jgi:hypothetical protein
MDQPVSPFLTWVTVVYAVVLVGTFVCWGVYWWRNRVRAKADRLRAEADMARDDARQKAKAEREAAERRRAERLRQIRDQLYLESLSEESRAAVLESRRREGEREQRAREVLRQEEAARGGREPCPTLPKSLPRTRGRATWNAGRAPSADGSDTGVRSSRGKTVRRSSSLPRQRMRRAFAPCLRAT